MKPCQNATICIYVYKYLLKVNKHVRDVANGCEIFSHFLGNVITLVFGNVLSIS